MRRYFTYNFCKNVLIYPLVLGEHKISTKAPVIKGQVYSTTVVCRRYTVTN